MKHIVGITPLWDEGKESIWMLPGYLEGIRQAGGLPIILPFSHDEQEIEQLVGLCDGILFTGGQDVSPEIYHEEPMEGILDTCKKRDEMETIVLRKAMEADKPILGICRGLQFINAALGGTLYQDLPLQHPSGVNHHGKKPYDAPDHEVKILRESPLYQCLRTETLPVNSYHHQAIKDLAEGLQVMATAPDGIVEAVCLPEKNFLWGVQWHPEFLYATDENSRKIFGALIEAMK